MSMFGVCRVSLHVAVRTVVHYVVDFTELSGVIQSCE